MKKMFTTNALLFLLCNYLFAQHATPRKDWYVKLSGGYVSFGTGVLPQTFGLGIDFSKNVVKLPRWGLGKLLLGGEWLFEQGVSSPSMGLLSPSDAQGPFYSFSHVSVNTLWPKVSYYPFPKGLAGFNIQVGPTIGHTYFSTSKSSSIITRPTGETYRSEVIAYDHGMRVGYRISTGYEFSIAKKWLAGFRADFSNTQKGEINTLLGLKGGIRF